MNNQPMQIQQSPKFLSLCGETAVLLTKARSVKPIKDIQTLSDAIDIREEIKEFTERAEKMRKSLTAPLRLAERSINSAFQTLLTKLDEKALSLTSEVVEWQTRNNPEKREIRTETAVVRLRRNAPVPKVTDKMAFLKAIVSKAALHAALTEELIEVNKTKLGELVKTQYKGKKLPPGVEMVTRPDSLV